MKFRIGQQCHDGYLKVMSSALLPSRSRYRNHMLWYIISVIFRIGQQCHDSYLKVMSSALLPSRSRYRNHMLWYIISKGEIGTLYTSTCAAGMLTHKNGKLEMGNLKSSLLS